MEPLFHQFDARASKICSETVSEDAPLTEDADLHLVTDTGTVIRKTREANDRVMFMIPANVKSVRIVSRTSRPSDVIGPFVDDRRNLGVLIGDITLFEESRTHRITAHLKTETLEGWSNPEKGNMRWTAGRGLLPLGSRPSNSIAILALQIKAGGPYKLAPQNNAGLSLTA